MSLPKFASFGWDLADPRVAVVDPQGGDAWNSADAVFISASAVAELWRELDRKLVDGSKGKAKTPKPSAEREQAAWNRVAMFARNLRRVLRRGGLVICRLDAVSARIKIRFPPISKCFPDGAGIDNYLALSVVHAGLAEWSAPSEAAGARLEVTDAHSPWAAYLSGQAGELAPVVALEAHSGTSAVLARDEIGRTLAAADSQVVVLPPLAHPDPVREAELLIDAAMRARSLREAELPGVLPAPAAADLERLRLEERRLDDQIERLRREREGVRRALRQREQLGNLMQSADSSQFAAAVAQALAILGMPVRGPESLVLAGSQVVVEAVPSGIDPVAGSNYVVSGRVRRPKRPAAGERMLESPRTLRLVAEGPGEAARSPVGAGETVVPASELLQAALAVLASPEDDTLRTRIRQSLHETSGIYRFDPV